MEDYPLIEDHGLIGDLQTAALVTTDGTIDWFCCPRFDSPSVFGALLDRRKGGHFTVRPVADTYTTKQLYHPDTAVLVTRFMTEAGAGEVVDFMPVTGTTATDRHRLVRLLRCVRGSITFEGSSLRASTTAASRTNCTSPSTAPCSPRTTWTSPSTPFVSRRTSACCASAGETTTTCSSP